MLKKSFLIFILLAFPIAILDAEPNRVAEVVLASKDWDKILDKYETLCNECIDLKLRAEAGENVSGKDVRKLLDKLGSLREDLKESSGLMSEAQLRRFERIKANYSEFFGYDSGESNQNKGQKDDSSEANENHAVPTTNKTPKNQTARRSEKEMPEPQTSRADNPVERRTINPLPVTLPSFPQNVIYQGNDDLDVSRHFSDYDVPDLTRTKGRKVCYSVASAVSVSPDFAAGLMFSVTGKANGLGGYIKAMSNFKSAESQYECHSDGTFDEGTMWLSGKSAVSKLKLSTGARISFPKQYGFFAGAGYGNFVTTWQDISGNWAKVKDKSASGLLCEFGILYNLGLVEFTVGVSTIAFKYSDLDIGVGIRF